MTIVSVLKPGSKIDENFEQSDEVLSKFCWLFLLFDFTLIFRFDWHVILLISFKYIQNIWKLTLQIFLKLFQLILIHIELFFHRNVLDKLFPDFLFLLINQNQRQETHKVFVLIWFDIDMPFKFGTKVSDTGLYWLTSFWQVSPISVIDWLFEGFFNLIAIVIEQLNQFLVIWNDWFYFVHSLFDLSLLSVICIRDHFLNHF